MKSLRVALLCVFAAAALGTGAEAAPFRYKDPFDGKPAAPGKALEAVKIESALEEKILALDPENVSESDVHDVLSKAPAPRIVNIHGGIYPVHLCMINFSEFLMLMGYPERSIRKPCDGAFSYSCYFDARRIAGALAWHYEREAMRPMLVGHSQGGIQGMKVLHDLAGKLTKSVKVWNPLTGKTEERDTILDPFTGETVPVVGNVQVSYASAVGAGGLTRILPNQWVMNANMRSVPDSVLEYTGFRISGDLLGGDFLGMSSSNLFKPNGEAAVRNVDLPLGTDHVTVPNTQHLARNPSAREWINRYHPEKNRNPGKVTGSAANIGWGADVWYSIKKHWVLELQRLIRAKRGQIESKKNETVDRAVVRPRVLGRRVASRASA